MLEVLNNDFIRNALKEIAENEKDRLFSTHSLQHAFRVSNFCKELCNLLSFSDRDVTVAALVHDIGMIGEKEGHAERGYQLLKENTDLNENILNAVRYHSFLEEIHSYEGAVLAICDKIDLDKRRLLPLGYEDDFHRRICLNIENVSLTAEENTIVINFETSGPCELEIYTKFFKVLKKGFEYLQVDYDVRINNESILGRVECA